MELKAYFKSIIDQDQCPVVICDMNDIIIYMNQAAVNSYQKYGGSALLGSNLLDCHNDHSVEMIKKVLAWFHKSKSNNIVHTIYEEDKNRDVYMVALRDDAGNLIGYYEKHEMRDIDKTPFYEIND